jgi:hypothetical protein
MAKYLMKTGHYARNVNGMIQRFGPGDVFVPRNRAEYEALKDVLEETPEPKSGPVAPAEAPKKRKPRKRTPDQEQAPMEVQEHQDQGMSTDVVNDDFLEKYGVKRRGAYYVLPDGTQVRGKPSLLRALQEDGLLDDEEK